MPNAVEAVAEDPKLTPSEKETTIRFSKDQDRAQIFSAEAGIMRRLLRHPEFELEYLHLSSAIRVSNREQLDAADDAVHGVGGTIPIGALKVSKSTRTAAGHANVVSAAGGGD